MFTRTFAIASLLVASVGGSVAAGADKEEKPKGFTVVRDPELGKPLVTLRKPPTDSAGRNAADVMEEFLTYVRDGKIEQAKKLCQFDMVGDYTLDNLPKDPEQAKEVKERLLASEARFPEFVRELQQATKYTLGATVKQKGKFWSMRVVAENTEFQPWPYRTSFSYENGEWRVLIHDLVFHLRDEERQRAALRKKAQAADQSDKK